MQAGSQVVAPYGFGQCEAGIVYHFLGSNRSPLTNKARAFLVRFDKSGKPNATLICLAREHFEKGVITGQVLSSPECRTLPPWLEHLQGLDLEAFDASNAGRARSNADRIEAFLKLIAPALSDDAFLHAPDPIAYANDLARRCKQNETRFRTKLLTYLAFGRNRNALLPNYYGRCGTWCRQENPPDTKLGRPNERKGKGHGSNITKDSKTTILQLFKELSPGGGLLVDIFARTMTRIGAKTITDSRGAKTYYHPEGKAVFTYDQYRYTLIKEYGLPQIQIALYGEIRHRNRMRADEGKASEPLANLLEHIEGDAYYVAERPRGILTDLALPPLAVCRFYCGTSGLAVGIGFSMGAERSDAYRLAMFSMAVDKVWFCERLFGKQIKPDDWPSRGLAPGMGVDRGAGAVAGILTTYAEAMPFRAIQPSHQARSKATAESGHPRKRAKEGKPTLPVSRRNPIEMVRRELDQLIKDNHSSSARARMPMWANAEGVLPTPVSFWKAMDLRGRNSSISMHWKDAVRTFLTPKEFVVERDGLWLGSQRFDSADLRRSGIFERVGRFGRHMLSGYVYDLAMRTVWVEVDGDLVEVQVKSPIQEAFGDQYLSVQELDSIENTIRRTNSDFREHTLAARSEVMSVHEAETGIPWHARARRAKKASAVQVREEMQALATITSPKRRGALR